MNRRKLIIGLLLLLIGVLFAFSNLRRTTLVSSNLCRTHHDTYDVKTVTIDNSDFKVLVAGTPAKWEYGLMNVRNKDDICGHDGMIFRFPFAMPQSFWNKNTLVDLDILWMKGGKKVGQDKLPAITKSGLTTVTSPEAVDRVIEVVVF